MGELIGIGAFFFFFNPVGIWDKSIEEIFKLFVTSKNVIFFLYMCYLFINT